MRALAPLTLFTVLTGTSAAQEAPDPFGADDPDASEHGIHIS